MRTSDGTIRTAVGVIVLALVVVGLGVAMHASGLSIGAALGALVRGAFGSADATISGTLVRATPLILTGLAVALAFRAGVFNIGAEGQLLVGAAAGTFVALQLDAVAGGWIVVGLAGATAGASWALIAGVLRVRFGVLEVISTILLNFLALYLVGYLVHGPLREPTGIYPQSDVVAASARAPMLLAGFRLHAGFAIAVACCVAAWWYLRNTASGFRLRAVGANARAAASAGRIDVSRVTLLAFATSGALAGAAGALEVIGVTYALYENISPGYGFTAIAVALLARLQPLTIIAAAIFFGGLETGANAMQREAGVPAVLVSVLEATLILGVLLARHRAVLPNFSWRRATAA